MEDASKEMKDTVYVRRPAVSNTTPRPASAPVNITETPTADTTVTVAIRRPKSLDDKGKNNFSQQFFKYFFTEFFFIRTR